MKRESVAIVALDLDDFKAINERHGHPFGDSVLEGVSAQLRKSVRRGDIAARTGGEEFALILPGTERRGRSGDRRTRSHGDARLSPAGSELSCSAGVAVYPVDADTRPRCSARRGSSLLGEALGQVEDPLFDPDHVRLSGDAPQRSEIERILRERRHRAALPARRLADHRSPDRLRGSRPLSRMLPSGRLPPGSRRPTPVASVPSSRRRRSGRRSSQSAARRDPSRGQREPLGALDRRGQGRPARRPLGVSSSRPSTRSTSATACSRIPRAASASAAPGSRSTTRRRRRRPQAGDVGAARTSSSSTSI